MADASCRRSLAAPELSSSLLPVRRRAWADAKLSSERFPALRACPPARRRCEGSLRSRDGYTSSNGRPPHGLRKGSAVLRLRLTLFNFLSTARRVGLRSGNVKRDDGADEARRFRAYVIVGWPKGCLVSAEEGIAGGRKSSAQSRRTRRRRPLRPQCGSCGGACRGSTPSAAGAAVRTRRGAAIAAPGRVLDVALDVQRYLLRPLATHKHAPQDRALPEEAPQ